MTRRARNGLAYALFLLLCAGAIDLLVGSFAPVAPQRSFRMAHPYYHHGLRALQSVETQWGGRRYQLYTDSLGFRDAAPRQVAPRSDERRVVLIGDSMIEGLGVRWEDTVAGLLAARGHARGVEVLNAASVSFSPKLYDLRMRWLIEHEGLALQRLVVFIDISDVHDEILYERFVPRDTSGSVEALLDAWRAHSLVWQLRERFAGDRIDNRFRRDADVDAWMQTVDAYRDAKSDPDVGRWEWTYDENAFRAWGQHGLDLARDGMASLAALCRERSIELVVVVYPSPYQIFANEREGRQVVFWRRFCEDEQVAFVDLFPAFVDPLHSAPETTYARYFVPDDVHWNETGNAFVADLVEEAVLGSPRR